MLQPRRPQPQQEIPIEAVDAADLEAELRRYPVDVRTAAAALLNDADDIRLSDLLLKARASGRSNAVLEVITLLVLQGFATEDRDTARVAAELVSGGRLDDALFYGDDLLISSSGGTE
jgi:hypothetical protein